MCAERNPDRWCHRLSLAAVCTYGQHRQNGIVLLVSLLLNLGALAVQVNGAWEYIRQAIIAPLDRSSIFPILLITQINLFYLLIH